MLADILKIIHIVAGGVSLLTGLGALVLRNRTPLHKPVGRIYFWSMAVIFITALYLSYIKSNVFLWCVACFSFYAALTAYRSLRLKKLHLQQKPAPVDWVIEAFFGAMHLGFMVFAIYLLKSGETSFGVVSLVFGSIGLRANFTTIKRLRGNVSEKNYWLMAHAGGMTGSYIAAITAFTVNNNAWMGLPNIVAWLGPTAILVPFMTVQVRKLKGNKIQAKP